MSIFTFSAQVSYPCVQRFLLGQAARADARSARNTRKWEKWLPHDPVLFVLRTDAGSTGSVALHSARLPKNLQILRYSALCHVCACSGNSLKLNRSRMWAACVLHVLCAIKRICVTKSTLRVLQKWISFFTLLCTPLCVSLGRMRDNLQPDCMKWRIVQNK